MLIKRQLKVKARERKSSQMRIKTFIVRFFHKKLAKLDSSKNLSLLVCFFFFVSLFFPRGAGDSGGPWKMSSA
jgi:hypothetical protein